MTVAHALIARTGSVLLRSPDAGGRRLSVLPPVHVLVARRCRLLASPEDTYLKLEPDELSYTVLISGPARTADIETVLILIGTNAAESGADET